MQFNSYGFMIFFPIATLVYFIIPKRLRVIWLLLTSLIFVSQASIKHTLILCMQIGISYIAGLLIDRQQGERKRKLIMVCSVVACAGLLLSVKYVISFAAFGLSYYTLSAISYIIDVYRKDFRPEKNPINYATYLAYFPKIVIGPIEKSVFIKQIKLLEVKNLFSWQRVSSGMTLMLWGYFEKMVLADNLSTFVTRVFGNYETLGLAELLPAMYLAVVQLLFDFCAGTDIAMGAARIMGLELSENFSAPLCALTMKEFWGRWHKSLSDWLKRYVYIPLGGNRKGRIRKYINLIITFVVSGLWHAINLKFVLWGFILGLYQVVGSLCEPLFDRLHGRLGTRRESAGYRALQRFRTFSLYSFVMLFFFLPSVGDVVKYIKRIIICPNLWTLFDGSLWNYGINAKMGFVLFVFTLIFFKLESIKYNTGKKLPDILESECLPIRWAVLIGMVVGIVIFGAYGSSFMAGNFVYFGF